MKTNRIAGCLMMMILFSSVANAGPIDEGKIIFMSRCAGCHNVNKKLTGPALAGIDQRHSIEWVISFVQSSQAMVKKGDKEAVALFGTFNRIVMPDHPDLTDENIKQIVEYIKVEGKTAGDSKAPFAAPAQRSENYRPLDTSDYLLFGLYLFVVTVLIMTLLLAVKVRSMKNSKQQKDLSA